MRFGVVVFPGSNCDRDCVRAIRDVMGEEVRVLRHDEADLSALDAVVLPGGFSYGDYLRAGAIARFAPAVRAVRTFADRGGLVLGICNGFQILVEAGMLPGALLRNAGLGFVCRTVSVRAADVASPFLPRGGGPLRLPVAHGEGRWHADPETLRRLEAEGRILLRYEENPNGSVGGVAGVASERGNVLGLMPHPERAVEEMIGGSADGRRIFEAMIAHAAAAERAA